MTSNSSPEQREFRSFEHAGWKSVARGYHDHFAPLTQQALGPLLDAVHASAGMRLLDVCTGPGYAAGAAAQRGAEAFGVDFSPPMIAQARRDHPGLEFLVGDAEELPVLSASFDAVVTNFGILHLSRPDQLLREAFRVLKRGGRVAFTVWAPPEEAVALGILLRAIEKHGTLSVPLPPGPPFFRFSKAEECERTLRECGFAEARVETVRQIWRFEDPDMLFQAMNSGTVRTGGLLRAQTEEATAKIRAAIQQSVETYRTPRGFDVPAPAVLAHAVKS